jgi:hypothetical protein
MLGVPESLAAAQRLDEQGERVAEAPAKKKLLVTGCGRSGTQFTASLLERLGVRIGHEKMRRDGIASWCMAVDAESVPWGEPRARFAFEHVFHQIRHPLDVIASTATLRTSSWEFICTHTPCELSEPLLVRSAKYWLYWNREAEAIATLSFRIENIASELGRICALLGVVEDEAALASVPRNLNTRRFGRALHVHDELQRRTAIRFPKCVRRSLTRNPRANDGRPTWTDLAELAPDCCADIRLQTKAYGYDN